MDGDEAGGGGHLGPVADPADVAGVAQRHHRQAHGLALVDADLHGLRGDRLAEAVQAVDHRQHGSLGLDLDLLVGKDGAFLLVLQVARHPHHAVAVMAGEVGPDQVFADALALGRRAAGLGEDIAHEVRERARLDGHHRMEFLSRPGRVEAGP